MPQNSRGQSLKISISTKKAQTPDQSRSLHEPCAAVRHSNRAGGCSMLPTFQFWNKRAYKNNCKREKHVCLFVSRVRLMVYLSSLCPSLKISISTKKAQTPDQSRSLHEPCAAVRHSNRAGGCSMLPTFQFWNKRAYRNNCKHEKHIPILSPSV